MLLDDFGFEEEEDDLADEEDVEPLLFALLSAEDPVSSSPSSGINVDVTVELSVSVGAPGATACPPSSVSPVGVGLI